MAGSWDKIRYRWDYEIPKNWKLHRLYIKFSGHAKKLFRLINIVWNSYITIDIRGQFFDLFDLDVIRFENEDFWWSDHSNICVTTLFIHGSTSSAVTWLKICQLFNLSFLLLTISFYLPFYSLVRKLLQHSEGRLLEHLLGIQTFELLVELCQNLHWSKFWHLYQLGSRSENIFKAFWDWNPNVY